MATYKQKIPRVQHVERDSETEESEQEWVIASNKPIERRLVNYISDEEDWHVLSDASLLEEGTPAFESNSELASGGSDYDSEHQLVQDETSRSVESFIKKMPSHDGTGNFFNATFSDGSNHESLTSPVDSNFALPSSYSYQDNESSNQNIPMGRDSRKSWITKFREVFRGKDDAITTSVSQEQTIQATQQIYHKFAESTSSAAKFELGDLGNTNPIKALANVGDENVDSVTYTTVTTQYIDSLPNQSSQTNQNLPTPMASSFNASIITRYNNRLIMQQDPMAINFAPTISKDMINEMIAENVNSSNHQEQQTPSQPDKYSILSTVWTTFRRITNHIIVSDDTDNDFSHPTNLAFTSSNHNTGLASIITGEYHYDTCYLPFGNHLALSELCPSPHNYYKSHNHYSSSSTPSTSSYSKRGNSIATSRILITPVSSSTSLKSFTSRAGSDCGLESDITILEAPLVL